MGFRSRVLVSTTEDRFNFFRDVVIDKEANAWPKFVSDSANTFCNTFA